jgi:hypothetical protein
MMGAVSASSGQDWTVGAKSVQAGAAAKNEARPPKADKPVVTTNKKIINLCFMFILTI